MRLRTLLSITHALAVVLFVGIFLGVFFSLSKPPELPGSGQQSVVPAGLIGRRRVTSSRSCSRT